jgi:hypothetical protein
MAEETKPKAEPKPSAKLGGQVFVYMTSTGKARMFLIADDKDSAVRILAAAYPSGPEYPKAPVPRLIGASAKMPRDGDMVLCQVPVVERTDKCCAKDVAEAKRRGGINYEFRGFTRVKE